MFKWFSKKQEEKKEEKQVVKTETVENDSEDVVIIYKDRVEIRGYSDATELAMTLYFINTGGYETSVAAALVEHVQKMEQKNKVKFTSDFTKVYATCLNGETKPEKPFIRPTEAFK